MDSYAIIPQPRSITYEDGSFQCSGLPLIATADSSLFRDEAGVFYRQIRRSFGAVKGPECIYLKKNDSISGKESYMLEIHRNEIRINAPTGTGIFRGLQVLRQLLLSNYDGGRISIPCGTINDMPRFPWRGFMLDSARNFFSVDFIKKLLDALCLQHINVFHWHLTDDQGWRLPVKKYPLLTEIGGKRWDNRMNKYSGGFYTEDEIRDIVSYAAARHIDVAPEVDLPGHASAILAAYPGLGCTGGPYRVEDRFGIFEDVLCAGNDGIFNLAESVFDTLAELFPSEYVHIGGDEVRFNRWKVCPKCRKRLLDLGLSEPQQIQSWITSRLAGMLRQRGKTAIGWDEILENTDKFPLSDEVIVMSWRNQDGGSRASAMGRRVIMTPKNSGCYLDYRHIESPDEIGMPPIGSVVMGYAMEPVTPEMDEKAASFVLGGQGNLWTENVQAGKIAEYLTFPRICGIAETLWTAKENKNLDDFTKRLEVHQLRLDKLNLLQYRGSPG